jgi:mRNA interferase MazF
MPKGKLTYRRGEIRWVKLDPTIGAEAQKTRACLIVQSDVMNQHGLLTIVMPLLPGQKQAPYTVVVRASSENGLDQDRYLDVAQIRSVSYERILGKLGVLEDEYWEEIQTALNIVLDFGSNRFLE